MKIEKVINIDYNEISCDIEYCVGNDGIGSYEYWGQTCYDKGEDYIEIENITPIFYDEIDEHKNRINKYIYDNFDSIANDILESWINE